MTPRAFHEAPIVAGELTLAGAEAHHLLRVRRLQVGDEVTLFDGNGAEFPAQIRHCRRDQIVLAVGASRHADRELATQLTLGVVLPKGDRQRWLTEKAVELGVHTLVPLTSERCVAQPTPSAINRLRRYVIEASKQCGRNRLMLVADPQSWSEWALGRSGPGCFLHPGGATIHTLPAVAAAYQIAVGPEGGWTAAECQVADSHGWSTVGLGPRTLRIETAALAAVSWLGASCQAEQSG